MIHQSSSLPKLERAGCFHASDDVDWHTHTVDEFVLVTAGECMIRCGDHSLLGMPGSLFVLPAKAPQYQETRGRTRTLYLQFDAGKRLDISPRVVETPADGYARRWIEDIVALYLATTKMSDFAIAGLLVAVMEECKRLETQRTTRAAIHPAVRATLAVIESRFTWPLTIDGIAEEAGVSASHLTALFRREIGSPPLRYQQKLRMQHACKLLRDPQLSVKQVSAQCGYDDVNYFVRLFHQRHGKPPNAWRASQ